MRSIEQLNKLIEMFELDANQIYARMCVQRTRNKTYFRLRDMHKELEKHIGKLNEELKQVEFGK